MTKNDGHSELDVSIQGHDIPYVTWVFIGIALLLVGAGIGASFFLRGSISMKAQMREQETVIQMYQDEDALANWMSPGAGEYKITE
jgi:hypothetical protein